MFRIGRDNIIINFNKDEHNENSIIVMVYGEVDCRCHIQRQINMGLNEDDVIYNLVNNYFGTIKNNATIYKKIIIVGVIPPSRQNDFEKIHGPITHAFPFVGSDEDRVRYTNKVNKLIEEFCNINGYVYFNPYHYYASEDGNLNFELSDTSCHLGNNSFFLEKFYELYNNL